MKLIKRGGIAFGILAGAAFVAAGCGGGGGGGGASSAAKDAAALELVPQDALAYVTLDTEFDSDGWDEFDDHARAFNGEFEGVTEQITTSLEAEDGSQSYEDDIDPWLGEASGIALISANGDTADTSGGEGEDTPADGEPEFFAWVELEDRAKFEDFLKGEDFEKGEEVGDFRIWSTDDDEAYFGVRDDYAVFTDTEESLRERIEYDGDNITDAEGLDEVIEEAGDGALATIVVNGEGLRKAVKETPQFEALGGLGGLEDFKGLAVALSTEDDGMRVHGFASGGTESELGNEANELVTELPGNTLLALAGHDLGGSLERTLEKAGEDNAQIQQGVGAVTGLLGVDLEDLAGAFDGDFAVALTATDEGLGAIAGGAMGAAMGGGLQGGDLAGLVRDGAVTLAFEETGETSTTLNKIVGAVGPLAGATAAPKEATAGDFTTSTATVQGLPITTASSDEVAAVSIGMDVFSTWGQDTLGDNETYSKAWEAAGAPKKTAGTFWLDWPRVAQLADLQGDGATAGGWVGWAETDGADASFDLFMHVEAGDGGSEGGGSEGDGEAGSGG